MNFRLSMTAFLVIVGLGLMVVLFTGMWHTTFRENMFYTVRRLEIQGSSELAAEMPEKPNYAHHVRNDSSTMKSAFSLQRDYIRNTKVNEVRKRNLAASCLKLATKKTLKLHRETRSGNYLSFIPLPNHRILFCHVPKIASTLNLRILTILSKNVKTRFPYDIHALHAYRLFGDARDSTNLTADMLSGSTFKYMFVRNPYERLYSAYLDKIYTLPPSWFEYYGRFLRLVRSKNTEPLPSKTCEPELTFPEFIRYVLHTFIVKGDGWLVDPHWQPYSERCQPCLVNYDFIGKLETFKHDLAYVLRKTRTSPYVNLTRIHTADEEYVINDTVEYVNAYRASKAAMKNCTTDTDYAERQWNVLQLRGIISQRIPFPRDQLRSPSVYRSLVEEARHSKPVSRRERKRVKSAAVRAAFKTVPHVDILMIQRIYNDDFRLFGYDINPPHASKSKVK